MNPAYLGLGSNRGEPATQLQRALRAIEALPGTRLTGVSSLYASAPLSPVAQPDFLNAAVRLETTLQPAALLERLQGIEAQQGRDRSGPRWGPRTLDIDLLLYADLRIDAPGLHVPHPELARRAFVLLPLSELNAGLEIPGVGPLVELLAQVRDQRIHRLERRLSHAVPSTAAALPGAG